MSNKRYRVVYCLGSHLVKMVRIVQAPDLGEAFCSFKAEFPEAFIDDIIEV